MRAALRHADFEAQAREWFVRLLDDDVGAEAIAGWEAWLRADPINAMTYDRVAEAWSVSGPAPLAPATPSQIRSDAYDGAVPISQWRQRHKGRLQLVWSTGAVAAVACLAAVGWTWRPAPAPVQPQQFATMRGEHAQAMLPDGSSIALGGMTALEVRYEIGRRSIVLRGGEALFKVAHAPDRPFVVATALGDITAVGTAFDVDVGTDMVVLSVTEGVVSVVPADLSPGSTPAAGPTSLKVAAGQRLVLDRHGVHLARLDAEAVAPTWMEGRLEYRNQPLSAVLEDVNRYADQPIVLADPALGELTYTGTVQLTDTAAWASGLAGAFPLDVHRDLDGKIILRKKTSRSDFRHPCFGRLSLRQANTPSGVSAMRGDYERIFLAHIDGGRGGSLRCAGHGGLAGRAGVFRYLGPAA
jgi:transmembrane sensor